MSFIVIMAWATPTIAFWDKFPTNWMRNPDKSTYRVNSMQMGVAIVEVKKTYGAKELKEIADIEGKAANYDQMLKRYKFDCINGDKVFEQEVIWSKKGKISDKSKGSGDITNYITGNPQFLNMLQTVCHSD